MKWSEKYTGDNTTITTHGQSFRGLACGDSGPQNEQGPQMPTLATIRNLQARIIYATNDGNHAEVLRLKKELENVK